jgi:hypothetical protein
LTCTVARAVPLVPMKSDGTLFRVGPNTLVAFCVIQDICAALSGLNAGLAGMRVFQRLVELYHLPLALIEVVGVVVVVDVDVVGVVVVVDVVVVVVGVLHVVGVVVVVLVVLGAAALTTDVGLEVDTAVPFLLLAVTTTRSVQPTSELGTRYVCADADPIGEHEAPLLRHRAHWKSYFAEGPSHCPVSALNVFPTSGSPEIAGAPVLRGAAWPGDEALLFSALALAVNESSATRRTA